MNDTDDILKALDDKEPEKKPSNWALWSALYFAEAIFVILDAVSSVTVAYLTGFWYYGVFVFLAGVVPLFLYTKQFTRPLATKAQRNLALTGGVVAVGSVFVVAIAVAFINMAARVTDLNTVAWTETLLVIFTVIILVVHAFVMARYFFIDEEVAENQKTHRMIARGERGIARILAANRVGDAKRNEVQTRKRFEDKFDPKILERILQMLNDQDEDGIPDIIDPTDNRTGKPFNRNQMISYAKDTVDPTRPPRKE